MLASALLSVCHFDGVNNAISECLYQLTVFALVLTTGNLLSQALIFQALQTAVNAACLALVAY